MKKLLVLLVLCSVCVSLSAGPILKRKAKVPVPTLQFEGETYHLAYSEQDGGGNWINEYLPAGEKLESWHKLLAVRSYGKVKLTPAVAVANLADNLKKSNPLAKSQRMENAKTGEAVIDFLTWPRSADFLEFNVFKFAVVDGVLMSYQFALREYENPANMKKFLENKQSLVSKMAVAAIPAIVPTVKK